MKNILFITLFSAICFYLLGVYLSRPKQLEIRNPRINLPLQDVLFASQSGAMIRGWYLQGQKHKGGVLLMHGLHSNRLQMLNRASFLYKAGYSVLLFDFQGHGESIGKYISFGYLESLDAEVGYAYLQKKVYPHHVAVIGISLGGASALLGKVKTLAKAMILESVYPSIEEAIKNRLEIKIGHIATYLLPLLTLQIKLHLGISVDDLQPIKNIGSVKGAVLIIGGDEDKRTTITETKALYNEIKSNKELWIVKGAKHIDLDTYAPEIYEKKILDFLKTYL